MPGLSFTCPVCGEDVPRQAKSCPECGACEKSGWSGDVYLDGIDLPGEDDDDSRYLGNGRRKSAGENWNLQRFWMLVGFVVLLAMLWLTFRGAW